MARAACFFSGHLVMVKHWREVKMKNKGLTLVEVLVLLVIAAVAFVWAYPNLEMARNRVKLQKTVISAHSLAMGLESYRVDTLKDAFVSQVDTLKNHDELSASTTPWLVPDHCPPLRAVSAWGGRFVFELDAETGRVNIGVPGRSGLLEFSLSADPQTYKVERPEDFNRGLIFRDGKMVVGPHVAIRP
jgi:type II secretory pathway pseudopilin PulG